MKENRATTNGLPPVLGFEDSSAPGPLKENGQHTAYWVLTDEEISKGFIRPVRTSYKHLKCGYITTMGLKLAQTYAVNPNFYSHTFCAFCKDHLPVGINGEFEWLDGSKVGT